MMNAIQNTLMRYPLKKQNEIREKFIACRKYFLCVFFFGFYVKITFNKKKI